MSQILKRLNADLTTAMKERDDQRLGVLRMLLSKIKEKQVEPGAGELDDDGVQQVLSTYAKQRKEAAEAFDRAGRADRRDQELRERDVVIQYLPEQLDDDAVRSVVREIIQETGASSVQDLGKVMKSVMQRLRGRVEGGRVQQLVRELLGD